MIKRKIIYKLQNIFIMVVTLCLLFIISEIALRIYWHVKWVDPTYIYRYSFHRDIFYELNPGWSGDFGGVEVNINYLGLRDDKLNRRKPVNEYRILVLGDSKAFGWKVKEEDIFTEILENKLNEKYDNYNYQVINAAVPGYNTYQEVSYLKHYGLDLKPDMVILNIFVNDISDYSARPVRVIPQLRPFAFPKNIKDIVRKSYFLQFILLKWDIFKETYIYQQDLKFFNNCDDFLKDNVTSENTEYWQVFMQQLQEFDGLLERHELPGILVYAPDIKQFRQSDEWQGLQKKIKKFAEDNGLYFIDLLPYYEQSKDWPFLSKKFPGDYHPNEIGHRIEADVIYDFILKNQLLSD